MIGPSLPRQCKIFLWQSHKQILYCGNIHSYPEVRPHCLSICVTSTYIFQTVPSQYQEAWPVEMEHFYLLVFGMRKNIKHELRCNAHCDQIDSLSGNPFGLVIAGMLSLDRRDQFFSKLLVYPPSTKTRNIVISGFYSFSRALPYEYSSITCSCDSLSNLGHLSWPYH